MFKFTLSGLPGGLELSGEVDSPKEVFEQVHFWQSLPTACPVDGTPTVLAFKAPDDNKYYGLLSTGTPRYEYKCGQHKTGGTLFGKEQWTYWDGTVETTVWENGSLTPAGRKLASAPQAPPPTKQAPPASTPPPTPPTTEEEQRIGRWTRSKAKQEMVSGAPMNFLGPDDAAHWAFALGATKTLEEANKVYAAVKERTVPTTKEIMWAAWTAWVSGILVDKDMWSK